MLDIVECDGNFDLLSHEMECEYEVGEASVQLSVQGRLKDCSSFWLEELEPSSFVKVAGK